MCTRSYPKLRNARWLSSRRVRRCTACLGRRAPRWWWTKGRSRCSRALRASADVRLRRPGSAPCGPRSVVPALRSPCAHLVLVRQRSCRAAWLGFHTLALRATHEREAASNPHCTASLPPRCLRPSALPASALPQCIVWCTAQCVARCSHSALHGALLTPGTVRHDAIYTHTHTHIYIHI